MRIATVFQTGPESVGVAKFEFFDFFLIFFEKLIKFLKKFALNLRMTACCLTSLSGSLFLFVGGVSEMSGSSGPLHHLGEWPPSHPGIGDLKSPVRKKGYL